MSRRFSNIKFVRVFIIPSESPNAFATGRNPQHAVVAVTADGYAEATGQVDVAVAVRIPHVAPPRLLPEDGSVVGEVGYVP